MAKTAMVFRHFAFGPPSNAARVLSNDEADEEEDEEEGEGGGCQNSANSDSKAADKYRLLQQQQ